MAKIMKETKDAMKALERQDKKKSTCRCKSCKPARELHEKGVIGPDAVWPTPPEYPTSNIREVRCGRYPDCCVIPGSICVRWIAEEDEGLKGFNRPGLSKVRPYVCPYFIVYVKKTEEKKP
jgi:hypothetical protein